MSRPGPPEGESTLDIGEFERAEGWSVVAVCGEIVRAATLAVPGEVSIGRASECDLRIDDPTISRRHAIIRAKPGLTVEDLGSQNGTQIGGQTLAHGAETSVQPNQVIEVGAAKVVFQAIRANKPPTRNPRREVFVSDGMRHVYDLAERIGPFDVPVLIQGETGAGKEHVAEMVHQASPRRAGALVRINCAAIAPTILESELFGYERGAFTGANKAKVGLLESGNGGSVFLDEIGEMPLDVQPKLLRVLEQSEVLPVGGTRPRQIDVRFIAATHRNIERDAESGRFRADLFYRLSTFVIGVPALRERPLDILPLAEHLIVALNPPNRPQPSLSEAARAALKAHAWPGNVRELRNVLQRAVVMCQNGVIGAEHLSLGPSLPSAGAAVATDALAGRGGPPAASGDSGDPERDRIEQVLAECAGNQSRAAEMLGISRSTLIRRLQQHGIARPRTK